MAKQRETELESGGGERRRVVVAAGLIWGADGRVLVSQRPEGSSHAGKWELPGGKLEPGETAGEALVRELREELDVEVQAGPEFGRVVHDYPELTVTLVGLHALHVRGKPRAVEVADFAWVEPNRLLSLTFPEANTRLFEFDWHTPPRDWPSKGVFRDGDPGQG